MIRTNDSSNSYKRLAGRAGDRQPTVSGFQRKKAVYTATGGEATINLASLMPPLSCMPGQNQLTVRRSSGGTLQISAGDYTELTSTSIGFPDALIAGEIVEIIQEYSVTGVYALLPRQDVYDFTATVGQTLIICPFSWTYNLNPSAGLGAVSLYIGGVLQRRGVDYQEISLGTPNTNTIDVTLGGAFVGGENVIVIPTYAPIDTSSAASTFNGNALQNLQNLMTVGTQGFVDTSALISVPNTTIVNRAKIPDLANDLRASLGIERIMTQSIVQLQNEFGPNGEPVYGVVNDDRGLIRFVGTWRVNTDTGGQYLDNQTTDNIIEVTFYGTGLNWLVRNDGGSADWRVSVDGGAEGSNVWSVLSTVLLNRNYSPNTIVPIVSGLSLGLHVVKFRKNNTVNSAICGFEIINSNTSGLVNINPGTGYLNGQKYVNSLVDSNAYKPASLTGTTGGRVVQYLNADGTTGQAVTINAASPSYTASASHTNEEVVRTYHWREFGAGRADDFSLANGTALGARAFTLDDGTTTLVCSNTYVTEAGSLQLPVSGSESLTFTFIGTGLDVIRKDDRDSAVANSVAVQVYVDGTNRGTMLNSTSSTALRTEKICSGLPYGTHTVKLTGWTFSSYNVFLRQFIVYQPKKPTLPAAALEICDYNVMGTYVANTTAGLETIGTGVLRKSNTREIVYKGTWTATLSAAGNIGGWGITSTTSTDYDSYTFFGTGFEIRPNATSANVFTISVDGSTNLSGYTTSTYGSGIALVASTGTVTLSVATLGYGVSVSGLALGIHTVLLTKSSGAGGHGADSFDIITPIHAVKSNLYADLQNTLPVGSCSLTDSRKTSLIKEQLPQVKSWAQAVGVTSGPTTTSTSYVPCPDMSVSIKTTGGPLQISYLLAGSNSSAAYVQACVYLNGAAVGVPAITYQSAVGSSAIVADTFNMLCPVGTHKIDLFWSTNAGTMTANSTQRHLTVKEL